MPIEITIQIAAFFVQLLVVIATVVVGLIRHARSLRETIDTNHMAIERRIGEELSKMRESQVINDHELQVTFGDSLAAIRAKITEVEIWSRDTFVREKDFRPIIESMTRAIDALGDKVDGRIDRLELKMDKLIAKKIDL